MMIGVMGVLGMMVMMISIIVEKHTKQYIMINMYIYINKYI